MRLLVLLVAVLAAMATPVPADARRLRQWVGWSGPAYADAGRGTFAYSGLVGMPGSPSVIRGPRFFVGGSRWWGKRL
jgi:hypothetical protein